MEEEKVEQLFDQSLVVTNTSVISHDDLNELEYNKNII